VVSARSGGLTGIGRAAAIAFAREGAKVVVAGRREEAGKALALELRAFGTEAAFINTDVRQEEDARNMVDETVTRFGRLDVAVNNAGTEGAVGPITEQTAERFAATFETNVLGVLLCMKHELRVMQPQGSGSIVNISSTMGSPWRPQRVALCRQQTCCRGPDQSIASPVRRTARLDCLLRSRFAGRADQKSSRTRSCSWHRTRRHSSQARSSASTAARPPVDRQP
jgi:NAD(P)-dependent dehydrogenase (short-subunit alcohol dehydrogenase family)